ncbi:inositol monophosphatase [Jatrophihabitans sp.]|uniref:inositol monophosphatase family protein n=1 Tax=Jatrophihabitans sp. TaxID=1932789 RepID=UPI0030C65D6D|nr:inositol monophosphatase family protein [Jatrophihabitans sp.]
MLSDFELAASLVRDAGSLAGQMLAEGLDTKYKTSVSDVVSAADHAAEELVVTRLRAERPDDGIIGEEGAATAAVSGRTWFVDPVDGTYNFLSGIPIWCAAVALATAAGPLVGAVYHHSAGELWLGGPGYPTSCNGIEVTPLVNRPLHEVSVASYLHPTTLPDDAIRQPLLHAIQGAATVRMLGSGSVELAAVAAGRLGGWIQLNSLDWDWLPGVALVRAAGGAAEVVEAHGHRWHLAGSEQVVAELSLRVQDPGQAWS